MRGFVIFMFKNGLHRDIRKKKCSIFSLNVKFGVHTMNGKVHSWCSRCRNGIGYG